MAEGRLGTGYKKYGFSVGKLFDFWLLVIPAHIELPWHTDSVPDRAHHRWLVATFDMWAVRGVRERSVQGYTREWKSGKVGPFRWYRFRPDVIEHKVPKSGHTRFGLTVGWTERL